MQPKAYLPIKSMNPENRRKISNSFQDVRLVSLASWKAAAEFPGRDRGGPYVVMQEGYDPEDLRMEPEEFVLGRSGRWLSLGHFYRMPVPERRAEFVFGSAGEVMSTMSGLSPQVQILRPAGAAGAGGLPAEDEMAAAVEAGRQGATGSAS